VFVQWICSKQGRFIKREPPNLGKTGKTAKCRLRQTGRVVIRRNMRRRIAANIAKLPELLHQCLKEKK
jgi:hypothetical protein